MTDSSGQGADGARRRPGVALVGIHGYGRAHLRNILRLQAAGALRLLALVDPNPINDIALALNDPTSTGVGVAVGSVALTRWYPDLGAYLADHAAETPDVVVVCTPIHTHATLSSQGLSAGCDVLLDKPPTSSLDEFDELLALVARTGRSVQVGFQTFGSTALPTLHDVLASGEIGDLTGVGAVGTWLRYESYWTRSAWTGRRTVAGHPSWTAWSPTRLPTPWPPPCTWPARQQLATSPRSSSTSTGRTASRSTTRQRFASRRRRVCQ